MLGGSALGAEAILVLREMLHDRMTEEEYTKPLGSFENGVQSEPVTTVPIMEEGRPALEKINTLKGLGFDDFDLDYYTNLFKVRKFRKTVLGIFIFGGLDHPCRCISYQLSFVSQLYRKNLAEIQRM